MKSAIRNAIRLLVVMALLLTSAVALAQDETETTNTAIPFVGIRFMEADNGVLVTGIITNTPAEKVGLQPGDIITRVNKFPVNALNVQETVWSYTASDSVTLVVERNGRELTQNVKLMARPDDIFSNPMYVFPMEPSAIGLIVADVNDDLMVLGTIAGSQAQTAGFEVNDIITSIDGDNVTSVGEAAIAMSDLNDGDVALFTLVRGEEKLVIRIEIDRQYQQTQMSALHVSSTYETDSVTLGYGDNFIQVQELSTDHELYQAGLRANDVIVEINGADINVMYDLFADESIALTVLRGNRMMGFAVPTSVAPLLMFGVDAPQTQEAGEWLGLHEKQVTLGVRYIQLEPNSYYLNGSAVANGAYIAEVIDGLPAAEAGIQVGDIIIAIDGKQTTLETDLRTRVYAHQAGDTVTVEVLRAGEVLQIEVTLRVATS